MSGGEIGTNDCTAEGRREAEFVSINVTGHDRKSTSVTRAHWRDVLIVRGATFSEYKMFPALHQPKFGFWGRQLVDGEAEELLAFVNDMTVLERLSFCPCRVQWSLADSDPVFPHLKSSMNTENSWQPLLNTVSKVLGWCGPVVIVTKSMCHLQTCCNNGPKDEESTVGNKLLETTKDKQSPGVTQMNGDARGMFQKTTVVR